MILLPLEIQLLKSKSQVLSRPVQNQSCKWHEFAYTLFHSTSLHPLPISPLLEHASKQQEWVTLSAPGEPVRLTIHKVLQSAQSKPAEQTELRRRSALLSNLWGCTEQQQICWQAHVPLQMQCCPLSCSSAQVWGTSIYKMIVQNPSFKTCFQLQSWIRMLYTRFNYKNLPTLECFILFPRSSLQRKTQLDNFCWIFLLSAFQHFKWDTVPMLTVREGEAEEATSKLILIL